MTQKVMNEKNKATIKKIEALQNDLKKSRSIKGKSDKEFLKQYEIEKDLINERMKRARNEKKYLEGKVKENIEKEIGEKILKDFSIVEDPNKLLHFKKEVSKKMKAKEQSKINTRDNTLKKLRQDKEKNENRIIQRQNKIENESRSVRTSRLISVGATIEGIFQHISRTNKNISLDKSRKFAQDLLAEMRDVRDHPNEEAAKKMWDDYFIVLRESSKLNNPNDRN